MTFSRKQSLYLVLFGIILTSALLAELIGAKIFSLENTLGIAPAQFEVMPGLVLDFNLTAGVILWPIVFVVSDLVNEYFGRPGVQRISFLTAACIAVAFIFIYIATKLKPAAFWVDSYRTMPDGSAFDINYAFSILFRQGLGIIIGSLTAFLIGQLLDAYIFERIKRITGPKWIWLRATGSTIVSQLIDSYVVLYIAFYFWGNWTHKWVLGVGTMNFLYKMTVAILLTPVLYVLHAIIDLYLEKHTQP